MGRVQPKSLPEFTPERLLERLAEAMQIGMAPARVNEFPKWTQRVMRILKQQFVPREFESILAADQSAYAEGVAVALAASARDMADTSQARGGLFARQLAERLTLDPASKDVAMQVGSGAFAVSDDFQRQIMKRLFAVELADRRAFVEGLAIGCRLPELFDGQAKRGMTDATSIYLMLWLYWPEISQLSSIGQVAHVLEPFFAQNKNLAGTHWEERIRKLANRIGLSFRAKQTRRRIART